jgi:hypothetical protein
LDQPYCGQCSRVEAGERGMSGVQMGADVAFAGHCRRPQRQVASLWWGMQSFFV